MDTYLTAKQVADLIPGLTTSNLAAMRWSGGGPEYIRVSPRRIVYPLSSIEQYLREKKESRTDQRASA